MLEHTFIHIQGIGNKTEQYLREKGIRSWSQFLEAGTVILSPGRDRFVRRELKKSIDHRQDVNFFSSRLSTGEMWRLFGAFKSKAVYLDIETSGGYEGMDDITVIGLYDGHEVYTFVNGINLEDFEISIAQYDLAVTFSGSSFDLPFIRRRFSNITLPAGHIDLRFLLKRLGYSGGLKKIEKELGICRNPEIDGMNGFHAVSLWQAYQWGDAKALETLIQYNRADVVNLESLMEQAYEEMKRRLFFPGAPDQDGYPITAGNAP